jgi:tRNA A-37 threonylcarbamoyl transferase component Bud32
LTHSENCTHTPGPRARQCFGVWRQGQLTFEPRLHTCDHAQGTNLILNASDRSSLKVYDLCPASCAAESPPVGPCACGNLFGACGSPARNFELLEPGAVCPPRTAPRDDEECKRGFEELQLPSFHHGTVRREWFPIGCIFLDGHVWDRRYSALHSFVMEGSWFNEHPAGQNHTACRVICRTTVWEMPVASPSPEFPPSPCAPATPPPSPGSPSPWSPPGPLQPHDQPPEETNLAIVLLATCGVVVCLIIALAALRLHRRPGLFSSASRITLVKEVYRLPRSRDMQIVSANASGQPCTTELTAQTPADRPAVDVRDVDSQSQSGVPHLNGHEIVLANVVAEGGFATVYRARWQGASVAVKVLKRDVEVKAFNEAHLLSQLRHPCICPFYGLCLLDTSTSCLVLEYAEGGTLAQFLYHTDGGGVHQTRYAEMMSASKSMGALRLLQLSLQIADGLRFLHSNDVAHMDIKCSNVLLDASHSHAKVRCWALWT